VALALAPGGRIVVAGTLPMPAGASFGVLRYTSSGALDTTFSQTGYVASYVGSSASAEAIAVDAYGRVLVAGVASNGARMSAVVARYWP
jgi:hypothetical protein